MEKSTNHFKLVKNTSTNDHPYQTSFNSMDWSCPGDDSTWHSSECDSNSNSNENKKTSSKSSTREKNKDDKTSGIFQALILLIIIFIAVLIAYALVYNIANWAIEKEEDWIRAKKGWTSSELVPATLIA